jgi:hypothetical protein
MRMITWSSLAALSLLSVAPLAAQPASSTWYDSRGGWDRDAFWRDAPREPRQRIVFLQRRIDRGITDGSLDRREARNAQRELSSIQRDARRLRPSAANDQLLQRRLDDLSQRLRWARNNGNGRFANDDRRFATDYDATRYYRDDPRYSERRLTAQDEVYRGSDGRYYCKRNDGTTGLIIGAAGGGVLGNVLDGGRNRVAGTLIGGALGALAGKSIDQNSDVRCR